MQNAEPKQTDQLGYAWRAGRPLEGDQLQAEVSSLIVGGLDTTAQTCAFTMFVTPQPVASCNRTHQGTQERTLQGICDHLPGHDNARCPVSSCNIRSEYSSMQGAARGASRGAAESGC